MGLSGRRIGEDPTASLPVKDEILTAEPKVAFVDYISLPMISPFTDLSPRHTGDRRLVSTMRMGLPPIVMPLGESKLPMLGL